MNFIELLEGIEPKLPGAPKGVQIMTPQQFVTKSAGEEEPESEVDEGWLKNTAAGLALGAAALGGAHAGTSVDDSSWHSGNYASHVKTDHTIQKQNSGSSVHQKRISDVTGPNAAGEYRVTVSQNGKIASQYVTKTPPSGWLVKEEGEDHLNRIRKLSGLGEEISGNSAGLDSLKNELWQTVTNEQRVSETIDPGIIANFGVVAPKLTQYIISNAFKKAKAEKEETAKMISTMKKRVNDEPVTSQETKVMRDQFRDLVTYGLIAAASVATFSTSPVLMALGFLGGAYKKELIDLIRNKGPEFIIALLKRQGNDVVGDLMNRFLERNNIIEATKLAAPTRPIGDPELTDYLDRIRTQQKKKTDKYKLPYIHRSSVIGYYDEAGKKYNVDAIKAALSERPKKLLKQNEKMKHSNGELEQFFNVGFAALVGIAMDENTNELVVVNTCPGAGSCKVDCFAMKGGKIQFQGPWLSDGRILTYLLNDPEGFFNQLKTEITKEELKGKKGGYKVSIRWHDAGDFFSPEYADMAFKLASELPNVQFYAYTKIADVALGQKPDNFMINWSEGASASQEKKVKAQDPELETTKNSRIVPSDLFYDLLVKDEKKNLVKGPEGQWQVIPDKLPELKRRLAQQYKLSPSSILSYSEWDSKTNGGKEKTPIQYNVIITPGEPDITAKSAGVLSTLLLKH